MRALVIGNAALDETFEVDVFPEPGQSIFGRTGPRGLGGKGANQAVMLGRSGVSTVLAAPIGNDARGMTLRAALDAEPIRRHRIDLDGVATDTSIIMRSDDGDNTIVTTREAALALTADMAIPALSDGAEGDWVILQGNLSIQTTEALLRAAKARGMITALNPSPLQPGYAALWPLLDVVFVNQGEAEALEGAGTLLKAGVGQVVTTLGGAGSSLSDLKEDQAFAAVPVEIVDTTGAGDCFMAVALASSILRGRRTLDGDALHTAAAAAAITVSRSGTVAAFPTATEMRTLL
ncbi:ribokinase [Palleronia abyssalis]|uniref:Ribokinase n=1 Tax=Palleronia abyssalis TaxID=1501240 RepID=A0A2R8C1U2_9RHOB|nr:ribokinase [Palleronia abyssalis]SPJ26395.1 Ribokinase [Palleronia abyssalis]